MGVPEFLGTASRVEYTHLPPALVATAWRVAEPLGPETGMDRSAFPEVPPTSTLPLTQNPASIGSPNKVLTSSFPLARARASV
jgi:hypothetical protein